MTGGEGDDRFVFSTAGGDDTITDFADGDVIEFTDSHEVDAYNEIRMNTHEGGTLLKFTNAEGSIFLAGVDKETLDPADFLF